MRLVLAGSCKISIRAKWHIEYECKLMLPIKSTNPRDFMTAASLYGIILVENHVHTQNIKIAFSHLKSPKKHLQLFCNPNLKVTHPTQKTSRPNCALNTPNQSIIVFVRTIQPMSTCKCRSRCFGFSVQIFAL